MERVANETQLFTGRVLMTPYAEGAEVQDPNPGESHNSTAGLSWDAVVSFLDLNGCPNIERSLKHIFKNDRYTFEMFSSNY